MTEISPPGIRQKQRIIGFDLARALAVIGMVIVNFKVVMCTEITSPVWLLNASGFLDGKAAATFVALAGIGISLLSRSALQFPEKQALHRNTLLRRALFLFVCGLLYTPVWPADILHFYGVYIAIAAFLLCTSSRRLLILAVALVVCFPILLFTLNYDQGWDWTSLTYSGFWTVPGMLRHIFFNGFHPVVPWLAFLLVGMVVGRLDLSRMQIRRRLLACGLLAFVLSEAASRLLMRILSTGETQAVQEELASILGTSPMPPLPLYMLAGVGVALVVIVSCVSLGLRFGNSKWLQPLVATGQLALTLYVAHVIVGMGTLEALGRLENQSLELALGSAGVFCFMAVVFAHLWRKKFRRGPLEALMRMLTDPRNPA